MQDTDKPGAEVMVIEDDAVMRELIADWLTAAGYRVSTAGNCLAGLAQAARSRPSLFVTDMRMPGPSGAAAISMLKQQHPEIGVIAISGYFHGATGSSAEGALAAGAARALAKPVRRADFLRVVAELIGTPP